MKALKNPEIPALTGIRALAAWWVVVYHIRSAFLFGSPRVDPSLQSLFGAGYLGVDLFFCLSGFVIAYNYWDGFLEFRPRQYGRFLWMRLARLYPVHVATLLLTLALFLVAKWKGVTLHFGASWTAGQFVQNILLIHNWALHPALSWNYPAWSISCEWLAYLAFPLLVQALAKRRANLALASVMFGALILLIAGFQFLGWGPVSAGIPRIAVSFFAGVVVFRFHQKYGQVRWSERVVTGSLILAAACLTASILRPGVSPFWMALAFPILVFGLAAGPGRVSTALSARPFVFGGRVSYSLYMTHGLVIMALSKLWPLPNSYRGFPHMVLTLAVYAVTIGAASVATYFFIEEPGRRWMKRRQKSRGASTTIVPKPIRQTVAGELQHAAN